MAVKDAVSLGRKEFIHGDDHLFIVVFDLLQVAKLPFDGRFTAQTVTYLETFAQLAVSFSLFGDSL